MIRKLKPEALQTKWHTITANLLARDLKYPHTLGSIKTTKVDKNVNKET